ncbi:hypothetical protein AM1_3745 [Acaryochloris marina MBIC11017]|uniref:Uncharacterized protein n=1 Tax=Acaryochloris marina (strain MBIC 11017) TaxID=329726 RepID=B0C5L4_ACAM1|nr:hypothetical protein AM1_3745 [Acaryochloris marina MBIC11017]
MSSGMLWKGDAVHFLQVAIQSLIIGGDKSVLPARIQIFSLGLLPLFTPDLGLL